MVARFVWCLKPGEGKDAVLTTRISNVSTGIQYEDFMKVMV